MASEIDHTAWQVAASWVVTGEAASEKGVRPRADFDPEHGTWGALQIAGRYHELRIDADAIALGFVSNGVSRTAQAWTIGANWYLNPFIKWVVNVERTVFDGDGQGARAPENLVVFRAQLSF